MQRFLDGYYRVLRVLLGCLMGLLIVPVTMQVLARYTGIIPTYLWTEEIARFVFVWIVMIGAIIAVRDGTHFDVQVVPDPTSRWGRAAFHLFVIAAMALFALVFAWFGIEFAHVGLRQRSDFAEVNMLIVYVTVPLAGVSWLLFLAERTWLVLREARGDAPTDAPS